MLEPAMHPYFYMQRPLLDVPAHPAAKIRLFGCKPVGLQPIAELHYVIHVRRLNFVCPFHRYQLEAKPAGLR